MDKDRVIDLIERLLALAASSNHDGEARAASEKVGKLLAKHGLCMGDIKTKEDIKVFEQRIKADGRRIPGWENLLSGRVAEVFDCKALIFRGTQTDFAFIGTRSDIELCEHFFLFMRERIRILSDLYVKKAKGLFKKLGCTVQSERNAFCVGMTQVLGERLTLMYEARNRAMHPDSMALIVVKGDDIARYIQNRYDIQPAAGLKVKGHDFSIKMGREVGGKVPLRQAISEPEDDLGMLEDMAK